MRNIFLIGFMGSGKSTVARVLSQKLGVQQLEMDERIEQEQELSITEIFAQFGEAYFRNMETELLRKLCNETDLIVSCGGGTVLREENVRLMKACGVVILLTASPKTILERVKENNNRPILNGHMNVSYITELMQKRKAHYEMAADFVIDTDQKNIEQICEEIIAIYA